MMESSSETAFKVDQRVHYAAQTHRTGVVQYVGSLEGYSGTWVGVDWDADDDGKHNGSHHGVPYFTARGHNTASFLCSHNLSAGVSLLEALQTRYQTASTKEEEVQFIWDFFVHLRSEVCKVIFVDSFTVFPSKYWLNTFVCLYYPCLDEMYVLSARNNRVSVKFLGIEKIQDKMSRFEDLTNASLSYLGVMFPGSPHSVSSVLPNLKELDLTGNLIDRWEDIGIINGGLPSLEALNLSNNSLSTVITIIPQLTNIRILVLNHTGVIWKEMEFLKDSLQNVEELHLMGNKLREITPTASTVVQGFNSLRLLNLENNCIAAWDEIMKLSQLNSLEQLFLSSNELYPIWYPDCGGFFKSLRSLLLASNKIEDLKSVDSLN